ncbi:5-hydroxytryptamine (serotonin) receptor 1A a [Trichomycterus rosablanca]|uniref:5-hydroxytryptamine (serotonin) receptor 1A a n=1 Tax=Trichomycterus rosablanca TaxID=2290929 RepID=UPI002F35C6BE
METGDNQTRTNGTGGVQESRTNLTYQFVTSFLLAALILFAVLGNACVITAIALERSLQNVANYLIGSLAVTDLMVSVLVLPMAALYQVLDKWTLGQEICDLFISLDVLCCTSSILHLCAIALDRYWTITDPIDYMNKRTPRRAAVLISLTWVVGFSISIPPMLGWRTAEDRSDPDACSISQDPAYTVYSTFGAFYLPLIIMLVLYGRIFRAARFRIRKNMGRRGRISARIADDEFSITVNGTEHNKKDTVELKGSKLHILPLSCHKSPIPEQKNGRSLEARRKAAMGRERRAVKTLGIIMGTFILCWLPFFTVALVLPFCKSRCFMPKWLGDVINWLGYSNSLLNPVIYAYFNKDFQNAFKKILRCKCIRR